MSDKNLTPETMTPETVGEVKMLETITVSKAQLSELIKQKRELQDLFNNAVEVITLVQQIFGGKIPTDLRGFVTAAPKIFKTVNNNPDLVEQVAKHLDVFKTLAPNYMTPELMEKFTNQLKSLGDGK